LGDHRPTVLVVDDEQSIRRPICAWLAARGYSAYEAVTGEETLETVTRATPVDVILLDLGLPDIDGIELVRRLRRSVQTSILILSVRDSQPDKLAALDAGADDYLTKPCEPAKLLERIRASLLRETIAHVPVFRVGDLSVDLNRRTVQMGAEPVHLTATEYELFKLLVINVGRLLSQRRLIREIWGEMPSEEWLARLRATVNSIRQKLEADPAQPRYIGTEPGIGYRLWAGS
jgi:two-component system, OmpR family, KDP operon response regulator KdpE